MGDADRAPDSLDAQSLLTAEGRPQFERRLSDKLLFAYNQAYADGQVQLAQRLRILLEEAEAAGRRRHPERRQRAAGQQADLWTAFCDARELYRHAEALRPEGSESSAEGRQIASRQDATLEVMRIAYLRWWRSV
jgi:hypothetical protein